MGFLRITQTDRREDELRNRRTKTNKVRQVRLAHTNHETNDRRHAKRNGERGIEIRGRDF